MATLLFDINTVSVKLSNNAFVTQIIVLWELQLTSKLFFFPILLQYKPNAVNFNHIFNCCCFSTETRKRFIFHTNYYYLFATNWLGVVSKGRHAILTIFNHPSPIVMLFTIKAFVVSSPWDRDVIYRRHLTT